MAQRVKLYEEKKTKKSVPLWGWVLAIVLAVALIVFFFSRRSPQDVTAPTVAPAAALIFPSLLPAGRRVAANAQLPVRRKAMAETQSS